MTIAAERTSRPRQIASTVERRWRMAVLLGLIVALGLAAYALIFAGPAAQSNGMVTVLKAASFAFSSAPRKRLWAGTTWTNRDRDSWCRSTGV